MTKPSAPPHAARAPHPTSGLQIVTEALDRLVAPRMREALIESSLRLTELYAVPDDPAQLGRFVGGPLFEAVERRLGGDCALCILEDLAAACRRAACAASHADR